MNQPMGPGLAVAANRPQPKDVRKQVAKIEADYIDTMQTAGLLEDELLQSPLLRMVYRRLLKHISEFLKEDKSCLEDIALLMELRQGIEWGPKAAEAKIQRLMGAQLTNIMSRTPAAP